MMMTSQTQNTPRILIKIGGAALQGENILKGAAEAIKQFRKFGYQVIVVHGGGPAINEELNRRGISWSFHEGQRITTPAMMDSIEMVLSGSMNSRIVRALGKTGVPAIGLSGTDGVLLKCHQASELLGQVGEIDEVNTAWVEALLEAKGQAVPVIAPLGVGADGETYNINADWAATKLAVALKVEQLLFFTDQSGIWNENQDIIQKMSEADLQALVDHKIVVGGMLTKTKTVQHALKSGINSVRILNAKDAMKGLWSDRIGTTCVREGWVPFSAEVEEYYANV